MADGAGLTSRAAAVDIHVDVEAIDHLHRLERLAHDHARGLAPEELFERAVVDIYLAGAGAQAHPRGRGLAAAGSVVRVDGHGLQTCVRYRASSAAAQRAGACRPGRRAAS